MRRLVNDSLADRQVRKVAARIVAGCPPRDCRCRVGKLRAYVASVWRFLRDPKNVELLQAPRVLLDTIGENGYVRGDCDDAAILGAALVKAVGLRARFVVVGWRGSFGPFSHVWTEGWDGRRWVEFDVTRPAQVVPPATRKMVRRV